ncbi:dynamin family protein [Microcoleus sp. FACHB-53]|nr:dynamin family protein [Microcoleus sp. FACHB-53]
MEISLISTEAVELLSRITGQKLNQRDLTPPVIFMAALITVLLGVMFVDGTITDEEKQRWQKTINRFIPPSGNSRQLAQLLTKGIRQNQVYKKLNDLQTLTAPLSESERLLLIGFGYEMSAADGDMDAREKKYLEAIANRLRINPRLLAVLEAGFTHQESVEPAALDDVHLLLAPARFHQLDTIFVKAASDMLAALPAKPEHKGTQQRLASSYGQLQEFQKYRKQLENLCYQVFQIIQDCNNRDFLPQTLAEDIGKVSQKLQSQRFRVAVVGVFSQGKSTLLNALLGEEIQPVRVIPCSGTVTVLKYGAQKRVVCYYKDKRTEEISLDQYQVKAAISEEAALGSLSEELVQSEIEEIVFEHPDLDLCRSGVEIVDSPGLDEENTRTAITLELIKGTDAVIFLANASRPLTKGEREFIQYLKVQLNSGKADEPAENLFLAVNFMDLLRREKDRQDVRQRIERFVQGENIIAGENRVHFISAQAALDAIFAGTEDEYLKAFQGFTQSIEKFLTVERGFLQIKQAVTKINTLIQEGLDGLQQAEKVLDGNVNLSEAEKQKIVEQIGEASGCDVRILHLAHKLIEDSIQEAAKSWDNWAEGLEDRIAAKSAEWYSECSPIWDKEKLIRDYADQFTRSLSAEIDEWWNKQVGDIILKHNLGSLDSKIYQEVEAIRSNFQILDRQISTNLNEQFSLMAAGKGGDILGIASAINPNESENDGGSGFLGGLGAGGLTVGALFFFTGLGLVPLLLAGGAAAAIGSFLFGGPSEEELHFQTKQKVYDLGFQKFSESEQETFNKVSENIVSIFDNRIESASDVIKVAISLYENLLEQQEKAHKETLEQRQAEKAFIAQKRQELEQVQKNIEAILPS